MATRFRIGHPVFTGFTSLPKIPNMWSVYKLRWLLPTFPWTIPSCWVITQVQCHLQPHLSRTSSGLRWCLAPWCDGPSRNGSRIVSLKPTEVSECGRPGNRSIRSISKQWVYNYSKTGGLCHGVHPAFIGALFLWCPSVHFPVPCWSRGQDSAPIGGWNQLLLTFLNL